VHLRTRFSTALWSAFAHHAYLKPCNCPQEAYRVSAQEQGDLDETESAPPSRSASSSSLSAYCAQDRLGDLSRRPRATRSCPRSFELSRRPCWRSSRQGARELPWTIWAHDCSALRALGAPGAVAAEVCGACVCLAVFCRSAHIRRQLASNAARRHAPCELQGCRVRYGVRGGLGSRFGCTGELAYVSESLADELYARA
jgi:hypothetical protein